MDLAHTSMWRNMEALFEGCNPCMGCVSADMLVSPQVIRFWEDKVRPALHACLSGTRTRFAVTY